MVELVTTPTNYQAGDVALVNRGGSPAMINLSPVVTSGDYLDLNNTPYVDVRSFGAVGDGVTDDTAAIQAAFNSASAEKKSLSFPAGTYLVGNLTGPEFIDVRTSGRVVLKKKPATTGNLILRIAAGSNWSFDNLIFDADYTNQESEGNNAIIRVNGGQTALSVTNCEFLNQEFVSIRVDSDTDLLDPSRVSVMSCRFLGGAEGSADWGPRYVSVGGSAVVNVGHSLFDLERTPSAAGVCGIATVLIGVPDSVGLNVSNCTFSDVGRCAINRLGCIEAYGGGTGVIVNNNRFVRAYGRGISVKSNVKASAVIGNLVQGTVSDGVNAAHGITMSGTADAPTTGSGFVCTGNVVEDAAGIGFNLIGETFEPGKLSEAIISGNVCRNSASFNFNIEGFVNAVVADNISLDAGASPAMRFSNVEGLVTFNGNIVDGVATGSLVTFAYDNFTTTQLVATGNAFRNGPLYGLVVATSASIGLAGVTISNNRFEDITNSAIRFGGHAKASLISDNAFVNCNVPLFTVAASANVVARGNVNAGLPSLTIASDAITVWNEVHSVDTEAAASTDDLSTINGGFTGRVVTLVAANNNRDIVLKDGVGNLRLNGDFTLTHSEDTITLMFVGTTWREISRSDNTA